MPYTNSELYLITSLSSDSITRMLCGYSSCSSRPHVVGIRTTVVAGGDRLAGALQCVHYRSAPTAHLQLSTHLSEQYIMHTWRPFVHTSLPLAFIFKAIKHLFISPYSICGGSSAMQVNRLRCLRENQLMPFISLYSPQ